MNIINCSVIETSGVESLLLNDYPYYRIPGIVSLEDGTMVIYYECRQKHDWSVIDIGMRVSKDAGKSWSDRKIIVSGRGRNAVNNPVMFADDNVLHLLYCENYKRMFCMQSNDNGDTWSAPNEITDIFDDYYWSCVAIGPGHGLVHSNGDYIAPVWLAFNQDDMFSHHPSRCGVIFSKDKGKNWDVGHIFDCDLIDPSEACLAELSNHKVLLNIRNENEVHFRAVSIADIGYCNWSKPHFDNNLIDPVCFAGMCNAGNKILFSNCNSREKRENLTLHMSEDDGASWTEILLDFEGGYSDVCFNKKTGTAFVLYETKECRYLKLAEICI